jgi:mono/diheme cytochrome c family protein
MKSGTIVIAVAVVLTVVVVGLFLTDPFGARVPALALRPGDARIVAQGERIYTERCASCHGARLEGQPNWRTRGPDGLLPAPPHDASGHTWHHPDELLFRITKFGVAKAANLTDYKSAMPVYEGVLSDEEIVAVLSWIKSRWPASIREKHDQMNTLSLQKTN